MDIGLGWRDIVDILLLTLLFYQLMLLLKATRALPAIYGLVIIILVYFFSREMGLYTLQWLLENFLGSLFIVIIVLFQRDIRQMLTEVGLNRMRFWRKQSFNQENIQEIVDATKQMSQQKIGALIVIERRSPLGDILRGGTKLEALISRQLLVSIFFPKTPLHDGAVIISRGKIAAAGCILPLTTLASLQHDHGTRHRAAIGVTEESDAIVIVVSEEAGTISLAEKGTLIRSPDSMHLERALQVALET